MPLTPAPAVDQVWRSKHVDGRTATVRHVGVEQGVPWVWVRIEQEVPRQVGEQWQSVVRLSELIDQYLPPAPPPPPLPGPLWSVVSGGRVVWTGEGDRPAMPPLCAGEYVVRWTPELVDAYPPAEVVP